MACINRQHIRPLASLFRKAMPAPHPVRVVISGSINGDDGDCRLMTGKRGRYFSIRINKNLSADARLYVLAHEWAHALSWKKGGPDHGEAWEKAYGRVWRMVCGDD